jgi:ABC-2 type transport system permease protein
LNDALRAVMIDGAKLTSVAGELGILGLWGLVAFVVALRLFRWQ